MLLARHRGDSQALHRHRIHTLSRSKVNVKCEAMMGMLVEAANSVGTKASYDVQYGGSPHELRYTECFAALGGIIVSPCCGKALNRSYDLAIAERNLDVDYGDLVPESNGDKYVLHRYAAVLPKKLILLPGSNLLEQCVDKVRLNNAVIAGGIIKPHPLTNQEWMGRLIGEYGEDKVLPKNYSGFNAMRAAAEVYGTGSSELTLYAVLLGKKVKLVGTGQRLGGYADLVYKIMGSPNPKKYLNYLLNSFHSGVFFPGQEDRIAEYVSWHSSNYPTQGA